MGERGRTATARDITREEHEAIEYTKRVRTFGGLTAAARLRMAKGESGLLKERKQRCAGPPSVKKFEKRCTNAGSRHGTLPSTEPPKSRDVERWRGGTCERDSGEAGGLAAWEAPRSYGRSPAVLCGG